MAVRIAGSGRLKRRALTRRRRRLLTGAAIVIVVAVAIAWQLGIFSVGSNKKVAAGTQPPLTASAKQSEDIGLVAGAVGQYAAAYEALPTGLMAVAGNGLVLCGATCQTTNFDVNGLSFYQASDIRLMPYAAGLTSPNQSTAYLVPGAKCGSNGQLGAVNTDPRSMVLLYASVANPSAPAPRCLVL